MLLLPNVGIKLRSSVMNAPKRWEDMTIEERVENLKDGLDGLRQALYGSSKTMHQKVDSVSDAVSGAIHDLEQRIKKLESKG
jgi:hypothetical protein